VFEVETRVDSGRLVLIVVGDLDLASAPSFRSAALAATAEDGDVVVDLTGCDLLDSVGVGLLLGLHRRLRASGRTLCVVCDEPRVRRVLELTEADRILAVVAARPAPVAPSVGR
jgi:anti-sigma B factor antagonist